MSEGKTYEAPVVRELGSVEAMTRSLDKVGSQVDMFTPAQPDLDGEVKGD